MGDRQVAATVLYFFQLSPNCLQLLLFSVNLVVTTPLTENMPGPSATKPGDMCALFIPSSFTDAYDDVLIAFTP